MCLGLNVVLQLKTVPAVAQLYTLSSALWCYQLGPVDKYVADEAMVAHLLFLQRPHLPLPASKTPWCVTL